MGNTRVLVVKEKQIYWDKREGSKDSGEEGRERVTESFWK